MRVQMNGRFLLQRVTGMQRYAREIMARLAGKLRVIQPRRAGHGIRGHLWEQIGLPWRLDRSLLWSPCTTGPLGISRQVVTIHDCAFHDRPECFTPRFAAWLQWLVPRLARRVRRVITVSEYSKQRICEVCRVNPEKVRVVQSGVDARFQPASAEAITAAKAKAQVNGPYVLCVGSLEPRKNIPRLLEAWRLVRNRPGDLKLVLVGTTAAVFADARLEATDPSVRFAGYVADEDLPAIYSGARAFIYPSLYEGFGLTVLEAMACGAPVVCSETTSLPEVAGKAAVFVNPDSSESIAAGIERILSDDNLRASLQHAGQTRARRFTWDAAAAATWQALVEAGD